MKLAQHNENKLQHNGIKTTQQNKSNALCCGDFFVLWRFCCFVHYWATVVFIFSEPLRMQWISFVLIHTQKKLKIGTRMGRHPLKWVVVNRTVFYKVKTGVVLHEEKNNNKNKH